MYNIQASHTLNIIIIYVHRQQKLYHTRVYNAFIHIQIVIQLIFVIILIHEDTFFYIAFLADFCCPLYSQTRPKHQKYHFSQAYKPITCVLVDVFVSYHIMVGLYWSIYHKIIVRISESSFVFFVNLLCLLIK